MVMQPAYTTTPYTIHYRGSLIKFNIRTRTSYHITSTILRTAAVYPVPRSGCVYSYAPYIVAPYSVPATASGTYSGHYCKCYRQNTDTIPILTPSYTVIRCCGIPRNTETKYRYSILWNTVKYRKNTVTRFQRTEFYKTPTVLFSTTVFITGYDCTSTRRYQVYEHCCYIND